MEEIKKQDEQDELEQYLNEEEMKDMERAECRWQRLEERRLASLRSWAERTDFTSFASAIEQRVVGQPELRLLLMEVYLYLQNASRGIPAKNNLILTAPSGCGKTETFRALRDYFRERIPNLVVAREDLSNVTSTGFRGKDPIAILNPLKGNLLKGVGILFLDEFDKKLMPEYSNRGEDVNLAVQNQLLCMVEGMEVEEIDTSRTMFIGCGSFQAVREARKEAPRQLGFGAESRTEAEDHFRPVTREEMLKMGACPELIGRFGTVVNYQPLKEEAMNRILDQICDRQNTCFRREILIGEAFRRELLDQIGSTFGVRLWETMIHEQALRAMLECGPEESESAILLKGKGEFEFFTALREEEAEGLEEALEEAS